MIAIALSICLKTSSSSMILPTIRTARSFSIQFISYHKNQLIRQSSHLSQQLSLPYIFEISMSEELTPAVTRTCEICPKEALFECSQCHNAYYCSRQHQFQHWKQTHKQNCQQVKPPTDDIQKKILDVRKSYYEHFSQKQFSECLLDAKVLVGLERKRLLMTPSQVYQLDYGGTICLLTKTFLLLNDKKSAKQQLENYLQEKGDLIEDLSDVPSVKQKDPTKQKFYDILQKKLNLISCIANLCYAIGTPCIGYYVLYAKIIITFFGPESFEASNCYFLIGCYYAEEGFFRKAIQCFKKAAKIRGSLGGDCLYNIGILYKLQGQLSKALEILEKALKLRESQYGQDSSKVAEINEIMGIIYTQLNDFKTAMIEYEKAFQLRSSEPNSPEFLNVLDLIHELHQKLCFFIEQGQPKVKKTDIYTHLKMSIENERHYWQHPKYKKKLNEPEDKEIRSKPELPKKEEEKEKPKQSKHEYNLILSEDFTSKLGLAELFRLSELQLELEKCDSQFAVIYAIGTSTFYQNLSPENYTELEKNNQILFQMIKLEELKKIKTSEV